MEQQGTEIDHVTLQIDYHIIEHFSKHLYSSPTKAVEELVVNGYDAAALNVLVYLPGEFSENLIIWDDGLSMNVDGLKNLWKVADSPKNTEEARNIEVSDGQIRKVIGKFGIGKIASYTIGNKISHVCRTENDFLVVSIDYEVLLDKSNSLNGASEQSSPIFKLTEQQAKELLQLSFKKMPEEFENFFSKTSWTFALIEKIKKVDLPIGRLRWVLGNGMPLKPDFTVKVNDDLISANILKSNLICEWDLGQQEVIDQITSKWREAVAAGDVSGEISFGESVGIDFNDPSKSVKYAEFPSLGKVWGKLRLYGKSLLDSRVSDFGRSHGFFLMVRDRLINPDDEKFLLNDPSFAIFYSSQYILHVDGLDEDLLADRERIQDASINAYELKVLQRAVYLALAAKQRKVFDVMLDDQLIKHRLPVESSEYFMEPLAALWIKSGSGEQLGFDFRNPTIESKPLGIANHVSDFSSQTGFSVNSDHPYYQNLTKLLGNSKQAQKIVKEFEVIAVSEKLFEGYLFELGIDEVNIEKIMLWRDEMYRKIAKTDKQNLNQLAENLREASYKSGAVFELAIVDILNSIGFIATRDGASGQKDVFVKAYCGDGSYKLTFEGKGCSGGSLPNDSAETGGANNHREMVGADCAVIITRKFAGFDRNDSPAVLNECLAIGTVALMEVEALIDLAFSVKQHSYTLESLKDVFTTIESPSSKADRIKKLQQPLVNFNYADFLNKVWEYQGDLGDGEAISLRHLWQSVYKKQGYSEIEIQNKVEALRTLVYPILQYDSVNKQIALMQSPENIINIIQNQFLGS